MSYKIDVLILHAENDNITSGKNETGWISSFQKFLGLLLQQVIGENSNILLKSENDGITAADIEKIAVVVPILSNSFLSSGKALDTLEDFLVHAGSDKSSRVFKVLKQPLTREQQPAKLRDLLSYELYFFDSDTMETSEFKDFFNEEAENDFWLKMVDLAYDIHESLILLKNSQKQKGSVKSIFSRKTIYLAETGPDLIVQRNIIKRELLRHGYKVIPNHSLPGNVSDLKRNVEEELDQADMSIHLIGNSYGDIPEGTDRSVVDIQNQMAVEKSQRSSQFLRMVWLPNNISKASERQIAFIETLKRDSDFSESSGIFQTPLEDFKNIIREELLLSGSRKKLNLLSGEELSNGSPSIYVLHDKADEKEVEPIINMIRNSGYTVLIPEFKGELLDLRQTHINNLQKFDAAVIYQKNVNDQWVRMKLLDLLKAPGFGRTKPIKGRALVSERKAASLLNALGQDVTIINGANENKLDSLKEFLKVLS